MEKLTQSEVIELLISKKLALYMVLYGIMEIHSTNTDEDKEQFLSEIEDIIDNYKPKKK